MDQELRGGSMGRVTRSGQTVRRTAGAWTPTVHELLRHVRARGVTWVPEPHGVDAEGREVVGFVEGDVPAYPLPRWVWEDDVLIEAARLLRRYHDATVDFPRADRCWQLPAHEPDEVVCHNDLARYNLVFRHGRLHGAIDFDTASPGPRIWDLAYLAYRLVPLTAPGNPDTVGAGNPDAARSEDPGAAAARSGDPDAARSGDPGADAAGSGDPDAVRAARLRRLCAAYGGAMAPDAVVDTAARRVEELAAFTAARAEAVDSDALRSHVPIYRADVAHLRACAASRRSHP